MKASLSIAIRLLFNERAFVEKELEHIEDLRRQKEGAYPSTDEFRDKARSKTSEKRKNLLSSFLLMTSLIVVCASIAIAINNIFPLSWIWIHIIRGTSALLIGWAVFGTLSDEPLGT